jgi:serine/threonine protein kinase
VPYIILELATGGELFDFIFHTGALTERQARYYFRQLIAGLEHIHFQGFAHRDLKLQNVLLSEDKTLKIADFGFAKAFPNGDPGKCLRTCLGTKGYQAPEIVEGKPYLGQAVDIFACGVILFTMVASHPPFKNTSVNDRLY